jgi:hypothetical protein
LPATAKWSKSNLSEACHYLKRTRNAHPSAPLSAAAVVPPFRLGHVVKPCAEPDAVIPPVEIIKAERDTSKVVICPCCFRFQVGGGRRL